MEARTKIYMSAPYCSKHSFKLKENRFCSLMISNGLCIIIWYFYHIKTDFCTRHLSCTLVVDLTSDCNHFTRNKSRTINRDHSGYRTGFTAQAAYHLLSRVWTTFLIVDKDTLQESRDGCGELRDTSSESRDTCQESRDTCPKCRSHVGDIQNHVIQVQNHSMHGSESRITWGMSKITWYMFRYNQCMDV